VCTGKWKVGLFQAPCAAPLPFLYGCCCTCCAAYQQRVELLDLTGEPYVCCAGMCPCGPLGDPQDRGCLIIEACCCPGLALSGNRFMVQTRFDRENTPCDDYILVFTCLFVYLIEIVRCFCDIPDELDMLADCLIMSVNGCMHAQQDIEIKDIKRSGYTGPPRSIVAALPPLQQKMVRMGKAGPSVPARTVGAQAGPRAPQAGPRGPQPMTASAPYQQGMGFQQSMPQPAPVYAQAMQPQAPVHVQCGGCGRIFGVPGMGIIAACPHCGTHNNVAGPGGAQRGQTSSGMAVAGGAGAGILGGMMMADLMF